MYSFRIVTLLIALRLNCYMCASTRLYFVRCNFKGFQCIASTQFPNKHDITFSCNAETGQDVTLYLWSFQSPANIVSLSVNKCSTLRLSFACTGENKPIQSLRVSNVTELIILHAVLSHNPREIIFEHILNLAYIPTNTFSQIKRQTYKPGCFNPVDDLDRIHFNDVNIGTIDNAAFNNLTEIKNFTWVKVSVLRVNTGAIKVTLNKNTKLSIENSSLDILEHLAVQVMGDKMSFVGNKFTEIYSSAINGTVYEFQFNNNSVNTLQPSGMSILVQNTYILDNHFEYLQSGAFQKIGPGLLRDSLRNFGKLKFVYEFNNNLITHVDVGGLHPDIPSYDNVATDVKFTHNAIFCTCEGLAWMGKNDGFGHGFTALKEFYKKVLDRKNANICARSPCSLALETVQKLFALDASCGVNKTQEELCNPKRSGSYIPVRTAILQSDANRLNLTYSIILLYIIVTIF